MAVMQDKHWIGFAHAMGRLDILDDPCFKTPELREVNRNARFELTKDLLQPLRVQGAISRLETEGVPCAPVLSRTQMRKYPQIQSNNTLTEYDYPIAGRLRQTDAVAGFLKTPAAIRVGAPAYGADTESILSEFGIKRQTGTPSDRDIQKK